ncbi:hypothetical protein LCGC14_1350470 [marine sediment metagenome]|uniref:Uncharacterized protein n=1 Tax=marine sediment metagenome TaxID=412755 RepID=A0A0F9KX68_9ZZZZ|nr:MAG: hypothetical protein Lokiarch_53710 [Candidatus Lokiarchaeum sp. GC14_75]
MPQEIRKYVKIGQIDATGVRGPHEKELEDISKAKYGLFIDIDLKKLKTIVNNDLGGRIENIGFNEDWSITLEMFPEVNIHMSYSYFGDEFGDDIEAEFIFYFSGKHVTWVPGEDSATYIDIVLDFIERKLKEKPPFEKKYKSKSELMKKVLLQRSEPFKYLRENDIEPLSGFLRAQVWKIDNIWRIKKEIFPEIFTELIWDKNDGLDIKFYGEKLVSNLDSYHAEFIGIFVINHILRFITVNNLDKNLPDICYIMFSRYYTKNIGKWDHRTR